MRFEVTHALDAIERRLSTDPLATGAVVDIAEAVRLPGLDGGRPANLLRLGLLVDALSRQLADESVALYAVAERGLLADTDLTSNERMVLRRWSDDGLIEIIPAGAPTMTRVCEIGLMLDQAVLTAAVLRGFPGAWLTPVPTGGAVSLVPTGSPPQPPPPASALVRRWRCGVSDCASFGAARMYGQPPPQLAANGVPVCPRHLERLIDEGPRPYAVPYALRVDSVVRLRFPLVAGAPVVVGRAPDDRDGIAIAEYLNERAGRWVSRTHVRLELADDAAVATDVSTNGSALLRRDDAVTPPQREPMVTGRPYALGEWDAVELYEHVELCRADRVVSVPADAEPGSVMVDAPTVALRLPRTR